jgi:PAS domain S-box-containing protein
VKLLLLNYEYPPWGGGGGVATAAIARCLAERHEVTVLTSAPGSRTIHDRDGSVELIRVPVYFRRQAAVANLPSLAAYLLNGLREGNRLRFERQFDLVNTHFVLPTGPLGDHLARAMQIPNVLSLHGGDLFDPSKQSSPHRYAVLRKVSAGLLQRADALVVQSRDTAARVANIYGVHRDLDLIPLGIERPPASSAMSRPALDVPENAFLLATTGRLIRRKATTQLVEMLASLDSSSYLVVIGEGPELAPLQNRAQALGVAQRIRFLGRLDEPDKFAVLRAADVFVSASQHEGFGLVFLEAMSCSLPVVAYDNGGQVDFLATDRSGFVVGLNDRAAFVKSLVALRDSAELRSRMGAANVREAQRYMVDGCARKYEEVFLRLVSAESPGSVRSPALPRAASSGFMTSPEKSSAEIHSYSEPRSPWLAMLGRTALGLGTVLLLLRYLAFDQILRFAGARLASDGQVGDPAALSSLWILCAVALCFAGAGSLAAALPHTRRWLRDALDERFFNGAGLRTPSPFYMLAASATAGALFTVLWMLRGSFEAAALLFTKEGLAEQLTFVLEISAACALGAAAIRFRRLPVSGLIGGALLWTCALVLFVVGMEEINWGQTFLQFNTPNVWARINYQQETSLHNLLDRNALTTTWKLVAFAFGLGAVLLCVIGRRTQGVLAFIAPHPSLVPLAVMVSYAGIAIHPELAEVLLAAFFAFYAYRLWSVSRRVIQPARGALQPIAGRVLSRLRTAPSIEERAGSPAASKPMAAQIAAMSPSSLEVDRSWTSLLYYTQDAIILWEMNGRGVLFWNNAAEELYGYSAEEAMGRVTHELLQTQLRGGVSSLESSLARFGVWVGELRHKARDGQEVVVEGRLAVLSQTSGGWLVMEVNRDIRDRKRAERQCEEMQQQLAALRAGRFRIDNSPT